MTVGTDQHPPWNPALVARIRGDSRDAETQGEPLVADPFAVEQQADPQEVVVWAPPEAIAAWSDLAGKVNLEWRSPLENSKKYDDDLRAQNRTELLVYSIETREILRRAALDVLAAAGSYDGLLLLPARQRLRVPGPCSAREPDRLRFDC
jgi:hypothetical protein